jgi:hypothetical protein
MLKFIFLSLYFSSLAYSQVGGISQNALKAKRIRSLHLCTSSSFPQYFLTSLPEVQTYWNILENENIDMAKEKIQLFFSGVTLWEAYSKKDVMNLGLPVSITQEMSATIKDCLNGSKTKLEACRKKSIGPVLTWERNHKMFNLNYNPGTGLILSTPGAKTPHTCNLKAVQI